jgi:uncharacterized phosphosugar-binding protein
MDLLDTYHEKIVEMLSAIENEKDSIEQAAQLIADCVGQDRVIFLGTGEAHGCIGLEEVFYRAGGLACMNPMLDGGICLLNGAIRTTKMERLEGYGRAVVDIYGVGEDDLVIIPSPAGITTMTIDLALECKERGAKVIGIAASSFAENTPSDHPSRHPLNKNLQDIADVFIDCHVPFGDAVLELEGVDQKFAPTSTIALAFAEHAMIGRAVEILWQRGIEPPIWQSANTPGGDEAAAKHKGKYRPRVKKL